MRITSKKLSSLATLTALATVGVTLLTTTPATATVNGRDQPAARACGLYRDGDAAIYRNCTGAGENIFVTYLLGGNTYFCVPAGEAKSVGNWNLVFRVYNRGGC